MIPEPKKVVIVEDEPNAADMFAEMMRISGYRVIISHSSTPAMSIIRAEMPDVVILDIMMPDISGIEVLRFLRREPSLMRLPVVIVSAKALPSDIQAGLEAGASAYLTKPVRLDKLRETVDRVIQEAEKYGKRPNGDSVRDPLPPEEK
jgi:two-component system sensor histidine kinase ChiS